MSGRRENRKSCCSLNAGGVMSCGNSRPSIRHRSASPSRPQPHKIEKERSSIDHERLPSSSPRSRKKTRGANSSRGRHRYNFGRSNFRGLKSRKNVYLTLIAPFIGANKSRRDAFTRHSSPNRNVMMISDRKEKGTSRSFEIENFVKLICNLKSETFFRINLRFRLNRDID